MIIPNTTDFDKKKHYQKNILYKITTSTVIPFKETHKDNESSELINLIFDLAPGQYGIFAHEYRSPVALKQGCKTADVLACRVDENQKKINTLIFDVKSNISAFSDDLLKENAMLTAIKEIRDFVEQIRAEILHKNSFILYYKDDGFIEHETIGIATKNFEKEKFLAVADMLERLFEEETASIPRLVELKLKNSLSSYRNEAKRIRDFSEKIVRLHENVYPLKVILLKRVSKSEYEASINICSD